MTRIELDDGKYTVVHDSGAGLHALRYGEHWRDMTGDGLVLAMAQEIEDLRRRIVPVQQVSVPVACSCGREYPANSYSAGFISGSGMCEVCDAAMPPKDIPQQASVPDVSAMARILADRNADACNVNREDNWAIYGQDYIDDVYRAMLAAAPAAPAADASALADAFLSWKLPNSVRPDGCAMDPTYPHRYGTNLMTWAQAKGMFEYVLSAQSAKGVV